MTATPLARASRELIERVQANAPPELLAGQRWVGWDRTPRASDGRPSKKPIDPRTGGDAKSNDQTTWASSADACSAALRIDRAGGVGFVLTGGNWIGVDLDHVIDRGSGELTTRARELLASLSPTYIELSPGGDGLHIWLRGRKPAEWRSQVNDALGPGTKLEVYDGSDARYFTITGSVWLDEPIADASDSDIDALGAFMSRKPQPTREFRTSSNQAQHDGNDDLARARYVLDNVLPDPDAFVRDDWMRLVAACCSLGEPGRQIAEAWCRRGPKYDPRTDATERQAAGFDGSITIRTLFAEADRVNPRWRAEYSRQAPERPDPFAKGAREAASDPPDPRPVCLVDSAEFHEQLEFALGILAGQEDICAADGRVSRILDKEPLRTVPLGRSEIAERLSRGARWLRGNDKWHAPVHPPSGLVAALTDHRDSWALQVVRADASAEAAATALRDRGALVRVRTGIAPIDMAAGGGLPLGGRIVMQGAPDAGKTLLITSMADTMACAGVHVGILAIDEDREDIVGRLLQRRGCTRAEADALRGPAVAAAMRDVERLPMRIYDSTWTIDKAAADLAAQANGGPSALFIDSIQVAQCDFDDGRESETVNIGRRMAAIRSAAKRYRMLVLATSEMARAGYRSAISAAATNDMATAKHSGSIEYTARMLLTVRSVPGGGVIEVKTTKNKFGPVTQANTHGAFLRLLTASQTVVEADDYQPPAPTADNGKRTEARQDAASVAVWLAEHPGRGRKDMYRGLSPAGISRVRADAGLGHLENSGAIVEVAGPNRSKLTYLIGAQVPDDVTDHVPAAHRETVRDAAPPEEAAPEDAENGCVAKCVDTPNTPVPQADAGVCVLHPIGGSNTHTHAQGAHKCAAPAEDDGQPERPKGKARKTKARITVQPERVEPGDADFGHGRKEVQP